MRRGTSLVHWWGKTDTSVLNANHFTKFIDPPIRLQGVPRRNSSYQLWSFLPLSGLSNGSSHSPYLARRAPGDIISTQTQTTLKSAFSSPERLITVIGSYSTGAPASWWSPNQHLYSNHLDQRALAKHLSIVYWQQGGGCPGVEGPSAFPGVFLWVPVSSKSTTAARSERFFCDVSAS